MSDTTAQEIPPQFPVTILTGFLGAGKTTLLRGLLDKPEMANTAVVINEFGEVGLDHMLVESADEDMIVMDSGCLCCTIRGDMIETLRRLIKQRYKGEIPAFDRLMIETTGLADPAPILHTLMTDPVLSNRYRLDGVLVCVDAVNGMGQLDGQPESVKQVAVADRILLTKTDLADQASVSALTTRLRENNPAAPVLTVLNGEADPADLFGLGLFDPEKKVPDVARWLREEAFAEDHPHDHDHAHDHHGQHHHDVNRHGDNIKAFCLIHEGEIEWDKFADWIESLIAVHGNDLLRIKGILDVKEAPGPVVIHGVQHVFHPPTALEAWPDDDHRSRIVMITRGISREPVQEMFEKFLAT
ncbi:CobW family GTP-binding protein [Aestuariispira insulae]|uniref:G3E family GTPase n=1 Tax=Aestuariispira insulae TaxID=1461337 RepID=A0A3D9HGJ3_9PROT|nr:GTP-binding protein [Aestuariispira insulae]RED48535.1 G3E family GTPase [Aestuariispira insulae]